MTTPGPFSNNEIEPEAEGMEIQVKFEGGPLDGNLAMTDKLDKLKMFFDDRQKLVLVYVRTNEVEYVYDFIKSKALTTNYDAAKAAIMSKQPQPSLRFFDDVSTED